LSLGDHWWCILVAKYGAFLFTEIGAVVITDYNNVLRAGARNPVLRLRQGYGACTLLGTGCFYFLFPFDSNLSK
jgi:hypothetical protein